MICAHETRSMSISATPDELRALADLAEAHGRLLSPGDDTTLPQPVATTADGTAVLLSLGGDYAHDSIDAKVQLHEQVRVYYVVDGYVAVYSDVDGNRDLCEARGETVWEAIRNLNRVAKKPIRGSVQQRVYRCPACGCCATVRGSVVTVRVSEMGTRTAHAFLCDGCGTEFWM